MSIKNDGDLLLTKARSVINMCMFVIFSAFVSFIVHFHPVSPFHYTQMEILCFLYLLERSRSCEIFSVISSEIAAATCVFEVC